MKRFFLIISMIFFCLMLINLFAEEKTKEAAAPVVNWILEDPSPDNGWDYCSTWEGDGDLLVKTGEYNNVLTTSKEFHSGKSCLQLTIRHKGKGYCGVYISTKSDNTGTPAGSWDDANRGKDISQCDTLEMWVKSFGKAKVKNIKIELTDTADNKTDKIFLVDYIEPGKEWAKVSIPLDEFVFAQNFNKTSVKGMAFMVEGGNPDGEYTLFLDDVRFVKQGLKLRDRFKMIFEDSSPLDGVWNFSGAWEGNGTQIEKISSQYDNLPISTQEKYKGYTSFKFHIKQKAKGYAGCYLSGQSQGKGTPPDSWDDYDKPKDISAYNAIQLWVKGQGKANVKIELGDTNKNSAVKIDVSKYQQITSEWKSVLIPFKDITWQNFDKTKLKEIKLMVDDDQPEGEFTVYIDNFEFVTLP